MRLIDADALRDTFLKKAKSAEEDEMPMTSAEMRLVARDIDNAPTVGSWVSLKDRLPEAHKRVLVAADFSGIADVDVATYCGDGMWESMSGLYPSFSVTHWMPLPEPPEEVNTDGEV